MNTEMDVIIAGLIGLVIGMVLMAIIGRGDKGKKDEETAKLQAEYDRYREQVNAHFAKTADAVDGLTKSYQQVFDHLSDGAQNLMDKKALQDQLEKRQGKAVTLAYLVDQEQEETSKAAATSEVKASSVVSDGKQSQSIDPLVKQDAAVPVDEKADVVAHANTVKTPAAKANDSKSEVAADTKPVEKAETDKPVAGKVTDAKKKVANADKKNTGATSVPASAIEKKDALVKAPLKDEDKASAHKTAENAEQKPAETIVNSNQHESAIDSVKKHIKDEGKGSQV